MEDTVMVGLPVDLVRHPIDLQAGSLVQVTRYGEFIGFREWYQIRRILATFQTAYSCHEIHPKAEALGFGLATFQATTRPHVLVPTGVSLLT